ncbi:hypothetical protein AYL99_11637 [Fonsecaea erecta]|uniref:Uncharacterized protein n=1 Tax=Fonsecaea erecta TaxID=1367422 RepID=A0A178Z2V0_9EURO|nr:hypothetical protein AYL99_11637 [Fonsecaea erecta]OAP54102.1 hypothetical protein AYL99_11637 [Fonsecaea erecta]
MAGLSTFEATATPVKARAAMKSGTHWHSAASTVAEMKRINDALRGDGLGRYKHDGSVGAGALQPRVERIVAGLKVSYEKRWIIVEKHLLTQAEDFKNVRGGSKRGQMTSIRALLRLFIHARPAGEGCAECKANLARYQAEAETDNMEIREAWIDISLKELTRLQRDESAKQVLYVSNTAGKTQPTATTGISARTNDHARELTKGDKNEQRRRRAQSSTLRESAHRWCSLVARRIMDKAQALREFLMRYTTGSQFCRTIDEMPEILFYRRKIEGAEALLAYETNVLQQELHKWQLIAPEPPPVLDTTCADREKTG